MALNLKPGLATQTRCAHCGERITANEPIVWLENGLARVTSRAAEPELLTKGGTVYHRSCFAHRPR
jgi:hypothetical protein